MSIDEHSSGGQFWSYDCELVTHLSRVLRENADELCEKNIALSLSPRCLQLLHESFHKLCEADFRDTFEVIPTSRLQFDLFSSLLFLYDAAQKSTILKVLQNGETLQGSVNIVAFRNITRLELKCLPLHHLHGLNRLRSHLQSITCTGCISRLQELLEQCGADKRNGDVVWADLVEVHLPYNSLRALDDSLRLAPKLSSLDLSHNNIQSTNDHLESLDEIQTLNLSYNALDAVPSVSLSSTSMLTRLELRNNLITTLHGVEKLICLIELDASNNLLSTHRSLQGLASLTRLKQVMLIGNPISYHKDYRTIAISCLHPSVVSHILLDSKELSVCEKWAKRRIEQQFNNGVESHVIPAAGRASSMVMDDNGLLDSAQLSTASSCSTPVMHRRTQRRRRPRLVEIADPGADSDILSSGSFLMNSTEVVLSETGAKLGMSPHSLTLVTAKMKQLSTRRPSGTSRKKKTRRSLSDEYSGGGGGAVRSSDDDSVVHGDGGSGIRGNRITPVTEVRESILPERKLIENNVPASGSTGNVGGVDAVRRECLETTETKTDDSSQSKRSFSAINEAVVKEMVAKDSVVMITVDNELYPDIFARAATRDKKLAVAESLQTPALKESTTKKKKVPTATLR